MTLPPPPWEVSENSSVLVALPVPNAACLVCYKLLGTVDNVLRSVKLGKIHLKSQTAHLFKILLRQMHILQADRIRLML